MLLQSRLTLFPHGPSSPETQEHLRKLLILYGSDHARIIEANFHTLDRFIKFAKRFDDVNSSDKSSAPIMVLTQVNSFYTNVVVARSIVTEALSALNAARWIIFADPKESPFFKRDAEKLGKFIGEMDKAPFWTWTDGKAEYIYLVLTPDTKEEIFVKPAPSPKQLPPRLRTGRSSTTLRAVQYQVIENSRPGSKP